LKAKRNIFIVDRFAALYKAGKRAAENGTTTTLRYYAHKFPKLHLTEPTVRRLKAEYQEFVKDLLKGKKSEIKEMPRKEGHLY